MDIFPDINWNAGTTALVVMASATEVMVSNCGDSRAVMCRGKNAVELSRDHKPFHADEKARIEDNGGWVDQIEVLSIHHLRAWSDYLI